MFAERAYRLCGYCVQRQDGAGPLEVVEGKSCFVCEGLMGRVPKTAELAAKTVAHYQFDTFMVGVSLPNGVQEREDELRSDLRLKGNETIKTQTARLVAAFVSERLGKRVDRLRPDLTVLAMPGSGEVMVSTRPVFYYGRYTKPRGILQKRERCQSCGGNGCEACRGSGFEPGQSVEALLTRRLSAISGSGKMVFTWLGSEDKESKVHAPGRPFIVEVKSPIRRRFPPTFAVRGAGCQVSVSKGRMLQSKPTKLMTFRFKTRIIALASSKVEAESLSDLRRFFKMKEVRFERPYDKPVLKLVYAARASARGRRLFISAELDGGLPVKRFVSGELVSPSVSEVLKAKVECQRFDILGVAETGS